MSNKAKWITGISVLVILAIGIQTAKYFQLQDGIQIADSKYNEAIEKIDVESKEETEDKEKQGNNNDAEKSIDEVNDNSSDESKLNKEETKTEGSDNQDKTEENVDTKPVNQKTEQSTPTSQPEQSTHQAEQAIPTPEVKPQPAPAPQPQGPQRGDIRNNNGVTEKYLGENLGWVEYSPGGTIEIVGDVTLSGNQVGH